MPGKRPDTQFRREIREFNREFLDLVCNDPRSGTAFGLPPAIRERLVLLTPAQLETIADTPCLLVGFLVLPPAVPPAGVAEASVPGVEPAPHLVATRVYAAALLTWLWHTARQDPLLAALCIGPGRGRVEQLASAGFRDLQRGVAFAAECLEARFCRHPRIWPDLVRAVSRADAQVLMATHLSALQLTLVSRG